MNESKVAVKLKETAQLFNEMAKGLPDQIEKAVSMIVETLRCGGKVLLFGNGGSAADAQHLAAEFVGRFKLKRVGFPAIALTANTSILTAVANDFGYEQVFARSVEALGRSEDIFIGFSTSGNSPNVVLALNLAKQLGGKTIAFTGKKSCKMDAVAHLSIKIPSSETPHIQEGHIVVGHIICELVEQALVEEGSD